MSRVIRIGAAAPVLAAALAAAALAGRTPDRGAALPARHGLPGCVGAFKAKPLPRGWTVPLPPGTVPTQLVTGAIQQVVALVPGDLDGVVSFFRQELARRGYRSSRFDAELGESEATFRGHGVQGQWRVNTVPGCSGATIVSVAVV